LAINSNKHDHKYTDQQAIGFGYRNGWSNGQALIISIGR